MTTVWICGFCPDCAGNSGVWELVGVFTTREKAAAQCRDRRFFIYSVKADEPAPEAPTAPPTMERPNRAEPTWEQPGVGAGVTKQ